MESETMEPRTQTIEFVKQLEAYSKRRLKHPKEVAWLLDLADERRLSQVFEDAIFHAKFATKTQEVMKRIGATGDGFDKLSSEFQASIERASTLLRTIVKESPEEVKQHFTGMFFGLDQQSFGNLMEFLADLSWAKNWEVDGNAFPWTGGNTVQAQRVETASSETTLQLNQQDDLSRISKASRLGLALMVAFLIIDPPVSILGWIIGTLIGALLLYNSIAAVHLNSKLKA
jgi:hypothetical protein